MRMVTSEQIEQYLKEETYARTEKRWITGLMEDNGISEEEAYDALYDNVYDYFNKN
jgi:hypothetical protein